MMAFLAIVTVFLLIDLGVFRDEKAHKVGFREAAIWSAIWVSLALGFYVVLRHYAYYLHNLETVADVERIATTYHPFLHNIPDTLDAALRVYNHNIALEFITGYLVEYSLSIDNIFVIILIFNSFKVNEKYYKKILFWGVIGAVFMRFTFIFVGGALVNRFDWTLYFFGAFLLYAGVKIFFEKGGDESIDTKNHKVVRLAKRFFKVKKNNTGDFFGREAGEFYITPLFIVLMIVELTDLVFAVDSVPAVFSITTDPYIVFFSNIFAILGLRTMFFFLAGIMDRFHLLKYGLGVLLIFVGLKIIFSHQLEAMGFTNVYSLFVILSILALSVGASLLFPSKKLHTGE